MILDWISVDVEWVVLWSSSCFIFISTLQQCTILTQLLHFALSIIFNSLALNQSVLSTNTIKLLSTNLITLGFTKSRYVQVLSLCWIYWSITPSYQSFQDWYKALLHMIHEWQHLKMLKWSGYGHLFGSDNPAAKEHSCALLCPACPQPGINLPMGWEQALSETRFGLCISKT